MAVKLDDLFFPIWVPDEDLEVKTDTYQDFIWLGISNFTNGSLMAY